jgi:NADH-quinone oxidoreductase subunit C
MSEEIKARIESAVPGCRVEIIPNGSPSGQNSLLLDQLHAVEIAKFLRDDPELRLDYCSNVTGIDWLGTEHTPEYLEAVYHLYSIEKKHGPVVLRLRTENRTDKVHLPSLTPVWRSAEFQEREIYDLYGIIFDGHPDLRRILMWDEFEDHPMRKDYVEPDDYEYEPTPHDEVLEKARQHTGQQAQ